ncbi:MAG: type IV pilus biogenesis/stability protein PilW [Marinobacter sp.]|uniref:type IV pilus biogenesis/stability protein PilW n=1 Tax=Marinobacter sp. TaxID=50741 RepID=UPI00299CFD9F|nr:type IV pilus biogenesis/stability protein PilW [Marinobacter sp.]MDX1635051.1 type IV pilus biogenesis/stability protein PilW [Marinobacter sp.]
MSNRRLPQLIKCIGSLLVVVMFAGCVTTTDSRFAREADEEKALEDYVQLATAYIAQGNYDRARMHLERAMEIDADYAPAQAARGLVLQREGETALAESAFLRALKEDSDYTRGRVYYAAFLYGQERYREARDQFAKASADTGYPDRGSIFYNLGLTERQLGDHQAAATAFKRAVELNRGDARSLLALSSALVEAGQYDEAARYYDRLVGMMARNRQMTHTPESLLTGIRLARHQGDQNREASLALLLRNQYPNSEQYQKYKALTSDDN